ncbi:MAG: ABC transporter ATP-binding protein, partial [Muribaculaceae bacterium]|nr:ABC transporter ATP-binding protein [Muribaculaceae bacterium]
MLTISNLSYCYPGSTTPALANMTLNFAPGAIYGLLGANGTGKSTMLYCMAGLLKPAAGNAELNGVNTFRRLPSTLSEIFIVPEEIDMPPIELKEFISQNAPFYPNFSEEQLNGYLEHFRLTPYIHLGRLSMGQRKKAFVAFALACNTSIILMDEPTNGLDIPGKAEFRRAVVSAMNDERTIVISTHQVRDLDRVLDHVVMIDRSGVVLDSSL